MTYELIWTPRSIRTFDSNIEYLREEWSDQLLKEFLQRVSDVLGNLKSNPQVYSLHDQARQVHRCVIHPRIVLYYRVKAQRVDLLVFWNTYQNPRRLKV
jgi:plasmid stabilization system protein ParE